MPHIKIILTISFILLSLCQFAQPGTTADNKGQIDDWNNWNFRVGPYFWFISLKGEIVRPPEPPVIEQPIYVPPEFKVDASFKEIKSSIRFAGMLTGIYRNKLLITQFHFTTINLESKALTPHEILLQNSVIRWSFYSGDIEAGYRLVVKEKFEMDILGGLKLAYFKIGASTDLLGFKSISGERDKFWLDPILAVNLMYKPWKRWELVAYADWGPDFFDKDYTYQYLSGVNFLISRRFFTTLGFRDHFLELPNESATYNGRIKGLFFRIGVQF